jgi:hypothetical protein
VSFEQQPVGQTWSTQTEPTYSAPTNFIVPTDGVYLLTYKLDVRSGRGEVSHNDSATVLTRNGVEIPGSSTLVEAPVENHVYTISNTVLCDLSGNDSVSLMFWSNNIGSRIGDPTFLKGTLPSGVIPTEATASIVFTRIS